MLGACGLCPPLSRNIHCATLCLACDSQALGIPYSVMSASDPSHKCRDFVLENSDGQAPTHWFESLEAQRQGKPCVFHSYSVEGCVAAPQTADLAVIGAPCHPFSVQRAKRFANGTVANHREYGVMTREVLDWLQLFEPKAVILEQVLGLGLKEDATDEETPLRRQFFFSIRVLRVVLTVSCMSTVSAKILQLVPLVEEHSACCDVTSC